MSPQKDYQGQLDLIKERITSHTVEEKLVWQNVTERLEEIKEQGTQTKILVTDMRLWRSWITGGLIVIGLLVIPLIVYNFTSQINQIIARLDFIQSVQASK